ncbi:MAG: tetratricopeptide repeat protein [Vicinamibacterales bacterium]
MARMIRLTALWAALTAAACGASPSSSDVAPAQALDQAAAATADGRLADARSAAGQVAEAPPPDAASLPAHGRLQDVWVLLRFGRWDEVADTAKPSSASLLEVALWEYAQASAAAAAGRIPEATRHQRAFEVAAGAVAPDTRVSTHNAARAVLQVATLDLAARMDWARGDVPKAMLGWSRAVAAEDALAPADPPDWPLPGRERLGMALLTLKNGQQAEAVFRTELERHPDNARALYGLAEALGLQGRTDDAAEARRRFDERWHGDGAPIPEILDGRQRAQRSSSR